MKASLNYPVHPSSRFTNACVNGALWTELNAKQCGYVNMVFRSLQRVCRNKFKSGREVRKGTGRK
jgi:hypothetical protein